MSDRSIQVLNVWAVVSLLATVTAISLAAPDRDEYGPSVFNGKHWLSTNVNPTYGQIQVRIGMVHIPFWPLMRWLGLGPACWFAGMLAVWTNHLRQVHRVNSGLCGRCGYDIRATPQRCPECGEQVIKSVS